MKMRTNKGKVYPSSSSSSPSPAYSPAGDSLSVLNLLPAAILSLAVVVLSVEDREVLAYMITRSIKSSNPNPNSSSVAEHKKKTSNSHKSPVFECDCFDCYTNYWFKWDKSVNRELIHQAIEAFEENLNRNEQSKKKSKKKTKKDEKNDKNVHRRLTGNAVTPPPEVVQIETTSELKYDVALVETETEAETEVEGEGCSVLGSSEVDRVVNESSVESPEQSPETVVRGATAGVQSKGLGKKVVADVIGLFNWRSWGIWNPNV